MWWAKYGSTTEFVLRVGGGDWSSSPLCSLTLVLASRLATVAGRLLDDVELEEGEGCGFEEDIACSMGEEIPGGSPIGDSPSHTNVLEWWAAGGSFIVGTLISGSKGGVGHSDCADTAPVPGGLSPPIYSTPSTQW